MQTKRRNFMLGGLATVTLATGLVLGGAQITWPTAQAAAVQPAPMVAAPVTNDQKNVAAVMPEQEILSTLYDQASPSVVNIQVTLTSQQVGPAQESPFPFPFPFGQGNGQAQPQQAQPAQAEGSGFVYDSDGHIVTNNHVVADADPDNIIVNFANGEWAKAKLIARDPAADLAVLQVTSPANMTLTPLKLAAGDGLRVGYYVAAIGSPFGLNETMTTGVVSALGRSMPTNESLDGGPTYSLPDLIQTDTAINPGNSGGPLLNLKGEVVGVNFAINSPVRANAGVGFAIPVSVVEKVVPALIKDGAYHYAYLGIAGQTITAGLAEAKKLADNTLGVYVGEVNANGPAGKAGLRADDIITGINQQTVYRFEDLLSYLFNNAAPNQKVTLHLLRDGKATTVDVTLGERPSAEEQQAATEQGATISVAKAVQIAKQAVVDGDLLRQIDGVNVKQDVQNGQPVWVITFSGDGKAATVTVDAHSGEVLGLDVQ